MKKHTVTILAVLLVAFGRMSIHAQKPQAASTNPAAQQKASPATQTKINPAKEADIRKLLDITGAKTLATQTMDAMLKNIKPVLAGSLPPGDYREKLIELFLEKFHAKADPQLLVDMVVPIYDKHLSHEEVKALIQFYQTPLGKKTLSALPAIAIESREAGEKWGTALGQDCMREVLAEHPDLAHAMEAAGKHAP